MNSPSPSLTRLAILRTIGSLHTEPLQYDLNRLKALVMQVSPDLLCADLTLDAWESGNLIHSSVEIREALVPAIGLTDTILLPIAPTSQQFADYRSPAGLRTWLSKRLDRMMRWGQRKANSLEAIHGMVFQTYCHTICAFEEMTWDKEDRKAFQTRTEALAENILTAIERDPGSRVLVVIQCQWHHALEPLLKTKAPWLEIVDYQDL